jgi:hypothetical protein
MKVKVSAVIDVTSADDAADPTPFDPQIDSIVDSVQDAVEVALSNHQGNGFTHKLQEQLSLRVQTVEACCVPEPLQADQTVRIPAKFSAGDGMAVAKFDAAPWFQQASADEILALAAEGWGRGYRGDEVAAWFDGKDVGVSQVYQYIRATQELPDADCGGSDLSVAPEDALQWLRKHRPDLTARLEETR